MFSPTPGLYRRPQATANTKPLSLLLISSLRDVINRENIMFWSIFWQHNSKQPKTYALLVSDKSEKGTFPWKIILLASGICWILPKRTVSYFVFFTVISALSHVVIKPKHSVGFSFFFFSHWVNQRRLKAAGDITDSRGEGISKPLVLKQHVWSQMCLTSSG